MAKLFDVYFIFYGEENQWHTPDRIYLDFPYKQTDLSPYFGSLGEEADYVALSALYGDIGVKIEQIAAFAQAVGAHTTLEIKKRDCRQNPQWGYLRNVGGDRYTSPIDRDFYIPQLSELLKTPSLELSRLIWRTLTALPSHPDCLQATYQRNQSWGARYADSLLVHELRNAAWVPQGDGKFVRPAEASRDALPGGFPFDSGSKSLKAIQFGSEVERLSAQKREKEDVAKIAGFADASALERAKRLAALPKKNRNGFLPNVKPLRSPLFQIVTRPTPRSVRGMSLSRLGMLPTKRVRFAAGRYLLAGRT